MQGHILWDGQKYVDNQTLDWALQLLLEEHPVFCEGFPVWVLSQRCLGILYGPEGTES